MAKKGPPCTICVHDRRHQIEIGLVHHVPMRVLATRFGVSLDAVWRHRRRHLTPQVAAAILAAQQPSAVAITSNLELVGKLLGTLVQRHDVRHTSILVSPDYLRLRSALIEAMRPYPRRPRPPVMRSMTWRPRRRLTSPSARS